LRTKKLNYEKGEDLETYHANIISKNQEFQLKPCVNLAYKKGFQN